MGGRLAWAMLGFGLGWAGLARAELGEPGRARLGLAGLGLPWPGRNAGEGHLGNAAVGHPREWGGTPLRWTISGGGGRGATWHRLGLMGSRGLGFGGWMGLDGVAWVVSAWGSGGWLRGLEAGRDMYVSGKCRDAK